MGGRFRASGSGRRSPAKAPVTPRGPPPTPPAEREGSTTKRPQHESCIAHLGITLPDTREAVAHWGTLCAVEAALAHGPTYPERKRDYSAGYAEFLDSGQALSGVDYARATIVRHEFRGAVAALFASVDLVHRADHVEAGADGRRVRGVVPAEPDGVPRIVHYTSPEDLTGCPALILPGGLDESGVPVGFQLVGRHLEEGRLFQAGMAYQADADWPTRAPLAE